MDIDICKQLVRAVVSAENPAYHRSEQALIIDQETFRIQPDEQFGFAGGELLVEYEKTRRPVESVSKYWWLFHTYPDLQEQRRLALVLILLDPKVNQIRAETVELLGEHLEALYRDYFSFHFVPAVANDLDITHALKEAIVAVKSAPL